MGIKEWVPLEPKTWVKTLIIVSVLAALGVVAWMQAKVGGMVGRLKG